MPTRDSAVNAALPERTFGPPDWAMTMQGRIEKWCEWFDLPVPQLPRRHKANERTTKTDELLEWCDEAETSIDWIVAGDPVGFAKTWREGVQRERTLVEAVRRLDDVEKRTIFGGLRLLANPEFNAEDVMKQVTEAVREYRAGQGAV